MKKKGLTQTIFEKMENDIVTGAHVPGEHLDEVRLAAKYGVSRTPIREALIQLSSVGLVKIVPNRGTFVSELSVAEFMELFEVMGEIEGMCAKLAARRIDPDQMKDLMAAQEDCLAARDAGSTDDYNQANEFFHRTIYKSSGNTVLQEIAASLQQRLRPYRRLQLSMPGRMMRSHEEHELIIRSIVERDSAAAETAMQKHIAIQGDFLNDFLVEMKKRSN